MVALAVGIGTGVAGIAGASISSSAQKSAAQTEANATNAATQAEQSDFQTAYGLESPYAGAGTTAENEIQYEMGLGAPGAPGPLGAIPSLTDPTQLPGYSFTLQQGENAVNNAMSAQGSAAVPGSTNYSGPQAKGNIGYAENLAGTYYNNYLQNYWTNQNNRYNMLSGLVTTGANAAATLGGQAVQTGANVANTTLAGTAAQTGYSTGAANTLASATTGLGSIGSNALLANALTGSNQPASTISPAQSTMSPVAAGGSYGSNWLTPTTQIAW